MSLTSGSTYKYKQSIYRTSVSFHKYKQSLSLTSVSFDNSNSIIRQLDSSKCCNLWISVGQHLFRHRGLENSWRAVAQARHSGISLRIFLEGSLFDLLWWPFSGDVSDHSLARAFVVGKLWNAFWTRASDL